jgi:arginine/ornithine N-succinyltransferase beta subunit
MNERIQQLAEEARLITVNGQTRYALAEEFEQRFAELIVAECANLIDSMDHSSQYFPHVADAIKEHFGVKQ